MVNQMKTWHERTQWNVGQGGFHTASVQGADAAQRPVFRYVYDCGSSSPGHASGAISEYVESLGSDRDIDAVFLSHIDADHVNGLPALLGASGVTVKRIFLPLLTPLERVIAIARSGVEATDFVVDLAVNPSAEIQRISDAEVVQVRAGGGVSNVGEGDIQEFLADAPGGANATIFGDTTVWSPQPTGGVLMTDEAIVRVNTGLESRDWILSFYVEPDSLDLAEDYLQALADGLKWDLAKLKATIEDDNIGSLLADKKSRAAVRAAYKEVKADTNQSSMMMLSGPESSDVEETGRFGQVAYRGLGATWLMTGDGKLSNPTSVKRLQDHLGSRIKRTQVIALPHHGSNENFHETLLSVGRQPGVAFAAAGLSHPRWQHPDAMVVKSVTSAGAVPWVVTENEASRMVATAWLKE